MLSNSLTSKSLDSASNPFQSIQGRMKPLKADIIEAIRLSVSDKTRLHALLHHQPHPLERATAPVFHGDYEDVFAGNCWCPVNHSGFRIEH
jgi:hypothetical protein